MNVKEAVAIAKGYVLDLYADENVTNLGLEEVEHNPEAGQWAITLGFSRPWNTPRSRAQELLENMGGVSGLKRSFKVVILSDDGTALSMKNRASADVVD